MNAIDDNIKQSLWAASTFARAIDKNGKLSSNYKDDNRYKDAGFVGDVHPYAGGPGNIHAGLVGITKENNVIISFRGTNVDPAENLASILDLVSVANASQTAFSINGTSYGAGKVHRGILNAIASIYSHFISYLKDKGYTGYPIYVTGHSKGGAMSTLLSKILVKEFENMHVTACTFAPPRVGDKTFKKEYDSDSLIEHHRFEAFLDAIPHLPLTKHEKTLLERFGTIHDILGEIYKDLIGNPDYYSVGKYYGIDDRHRNTKYSSSIPFNENNPNNETLNSFCAIEQLVRGLGIPEGLNAIINDIHNNDYPE